MGNLVAMKKYFHLVCRKILDLFPTKKNILAESIHVMSGLSTTKPLHHVMTQFTSFLLYW